MKHSEMEIYLEQHLIELRGYQDDNAEIVDVLLYAIEEAGMLPPVYAKKIFKKFSTGGYYEYPEVNEWEPENDAE
jgi:endonuclease III-like uncharacterized protein